MNVLCLHHNDSDGRACGAIVRYALGSTVQLFEIDYGDRIPWELIQEAEQVIIVDFSLSYPEMEKIAGERELIWIDHHISAIQAMGGLVKSILGIRDISEAGCVLCWRYFFPDQLIPDAIVLIGDRDIWRQAEPDSPAFNEGLIHENTHPENDELWLPLLRNDPITLQRLINKGKILLEARLGTIRRQVQRYGYQVTFEGYRTLVINRAGDADLGHHMLSLGYEIAYCYTEGFQNGKLITFVTLYANQVDVSVIAKKFGGGGHRGAAGFSLPRSDPPFPDSADLKF
jgi:oligoribonuclease NrnB/cAMP/cGMP phosphodiesterase (DHH superfamily)